VLAVYGLTALAFALFPNRGTPQMASANEPAIFVCTSLAHADIVLPLSDPLVDWRKRFGTVITPDLPGNLYVAFGWGDLVFFRETPEWQDLQPSLAALALTGRNDTALRVVVVNPPDSDPECRAVNLARENRRKLVGFILATLKDETDGGPYMHKGSSRFEAFYVARGTYGPFNTCNQWVADGLREAGLPHARFAPFSFSVKWPLQNVP
jgi:uncharacterized protein (TIGR02117 family)